MPEDGAEADVEDEALAEPEASVTSGESSKPEGDAEDDDDVEDEASAEPEASVSSGAPTVISDSS